jgi:hypothetical protein
MAEKTKDIEPLKQHDHTFLGLMLLVFGVLAIVLYTLQSEVIGFLILPALGVAFLAWGFYTHRFPLTIPGCILTGLGVGVFLSTRMVGGSDSSDGGVVVLGLAFGFLGILLVAPYFQEKRVWWTLIPAGILGLVGLLLVIGGDALNMLESIGDYWPVILIVIGLYVLISPRRNRR